MNPTGTPSVSGTIGPESSPLPAYRQAGETLKCGSLEAGQWRFVAEGYSALDDMGNGTDRQTHGRRFLALWHRTEQKNSRNLCGALQGAEIGGISCGGK